VDVLIIDPALYPKNFKNSMILGLIFLFTNSEDSPKIERITVNNAGNKTKIIRIMISIVFESQEKKLLVLLLLLVSSELKENALFDLLLEKLLFSIFVSARLLLVLEKDSSIRFILFIQYIYFLSIHSIPLLQTYFIPKKNIFVQI
jgi:hypothetical protein